MTTIKDVAKRAEVSITTVSHVINGTRYVSDALTQKVHEAMNALNYRPNSLARSLRSGRSRSIGLVIPDISNLFFAEISRKIEDNGFLHQYSVILCNTDDDPKKESAYINVLLEKQVDGIIFISSGSKGEGLNQIQQSKIPIVIADRDMKNINADIVLVDNWAGGYEATNYLITLGHERIGCITGPSVVTPSALRVEGYKQALSEKNIPFASELVVSGDFRFEGGEKAMRQLIDLEERPTAVFVCNDMMALGAMRAINDANLAIPDDLSIIGFDNIPLSNTTVPSLSTTEQPVAEMAKIVVDLLINRIRMEEEKRKGDNINTEYSNIVLKTKLILRESCKAR